MIMGSATSAPALPTNTILVEHIDKRALSVVHVSEDVLRRFSAPIQEAQTVSPKSSESEEKLR